MKDTVITGGGQGMAPESSCQDGLLARVYIRQFSTVKKQHEDKPRCRAQTATKNHG